MKTFSSSWLILIVFQFALAHLSSGQSLKRSEYFIDNDPGYGQGKPIPTATTLDVSIEIPLDGLSVGLHKIYVRIQDQNNVWSQTESRDFLVEATAAVNSASIVSAEFFFDADPGVGNANPLSITSGPEVEIDREIQIEGLSSGFHKLFIRIKDSRGIWSQYLDLTFFVEPSLNQPASMINLAEYFIDQDPGVGLATKIATDGTANIEIPINGINSGIHELGVRTRDSGDKWSHTELRKFLIDDKLIEPNFLVSGEVYFDDFDPEPGSGIQLNFAPGANVIVQDEIQVAALSVGGHNIGVRMRDNDGTLSVLETQPITIAVPRVDKLIPNSGGNIGDLSLNIQGASFDDKVSLRFVKTGAPDIVVPSDSLSVYGGEHIQTFMNLRNRPLGKYDVIVSFSDGSVITVKEGFEIVAGIPNETWTEVLGFNRIRRNQWQTYTITYGNRGNVDAKGVPLWIVLGKAENIEFKLDFELTKPPGYEGTIDFDTIDYYFTTDSLFDEAYHAKVIPLYIPIIPSGTTDALNIRIRTNEAFEIFAYTNPPFYNSPLSDAVQTCVKLAVEEGFQKVLKKNLPILGCGFSAFEAVTEYQKYLNKVPGGPTKASLMWNFASMIVSCSETVLLPVAVGKVLFETFEFLNRVKDATACVDAYKIVVNERKPRYELEEFERRRVVPVFSFDPNDKLGAEGIGVNKFVAGDNELEYLIRFENKESASAAAQTVQILDTLDVTRLDLSTFELHFMSFADKYVHIPPGKKSFTSEVDLRPNYDLRVKLEAKLDTTNGIVSWYYESIDPITRAKVDDPTLGFLPPNVESPEGEGSVFFTIKSKTDLITGARIENRAYIYFDNNEVIPTPTWFNSLDKGLPESNVLPLAERQNSDSFQVSWNGEDAGAGIKYFMVYASENEGDYSLWLQTPEREATFEGKMNSTYRFYTIAFDSTGHYEIAPTSYDAITTTTVVTGTEQEVENGIIFYPNPASGRLIVKVPPGLINSSVHISTLQGKQIYQLNSIESTNFELDISKLPKGLFFISFEYQGKTITRKVVFN